MATALDHIPLHTEAIQTDHAVQFGSHEEDERPDEAHVIGVNGGEVRFDFRRSGEHAHHVREHHAGKNDGGDELHEPQGRIRVMHELHVSADVAELTIGRREAAKSAESVNDHAEGDDAHEEEVSPSLFMAEDGSKAGNLAQVPEHVLTELDGAREAHVAEEEKAEDEAGHGLSHIEVSGPLAAALSILESHTGDNFAARGSVSELDLFRSRHNESSLVWGWAATVADAAFFFRWRNNAPLRNLNL